MIRDELGLYHAIENSLKQSKHPLTCTELYDDPGVRKFAASVNRVSDYLGNLWRKKLVVRLPAPKIPGSAARWAYEWKKATTGAQQAPVPIPPPSPILLNRPSITITDDGREVIIDLPALSIVIRPKS